MSHAQPDQIVRPQGVFSREDWSDAMRAKPPFFGTTASRTITCDVVVIGSGAGGGVMAAELAQAGYDVVIIEEGSYYPTEAFTTESSKMIRALYRDGGASTSLGSPPIPYAEGRCVGGSTVINGGMSWRTPERILSKWRREHDLDGIEACDMEPHFERVEAMCSVTPQNDESIGRDNEIIRQGSEKMGWNVVKNTRNQVHCAGTNNCVFGCPTAAKRSTLVTYIPRALHYGARLFSDCRAETLITKGKRIEGVRARVVREDRSSGGVVNIMARATIVCCGAIHSPALLQRSKIRTPSGRIGHNLTLHPNSKLMAEFEEDIEGWKGVHQAYQVREFQDEGIVMAAVNVPPSLMAMGLPYYGKQMGERLKRYNKMVSAGLLVEDTTTGRVISGPGGVPVTLYELSDLDAQTLVRGTALLAEMLFEFGATQIVTPFKHIPELNSQDDIKKFFAQPIPKKSMELMTVHMMGTCAMGGDPARHVCDNNGKVWGTEGLYVADASLFPTPIGVNPMETIMALATRNSQRMINSNLDPRPTTFNSSRHIV